MRARAVSLNIVSMIDVFAVLVFFLLVSSSITAAKLNVVKLNLPSPDQKIVPDKPPLQLSITLRHKGLEVSDRNGGLRQLPNTAEGYDLDALGKLLAQIKASAPGENTVTLLLEPDIPYDDLIHVMDAARYAPLDAGSVAARTEMFPNISLGDAAGAKP
ncbi:Biopolymer transport protein ExbD [Solimonas aquatica]|uniref:Biopolymer transport protein ExbD n=2 Tax=Solimonas aquatica TaxID=489703 RepID=A0A1H9HZI8_9GAMM|nr:Biopolymer transport protein ExbD [Solimonas aquatica]